MSPPGGFAESAKNFPIASAAGQYTLGSVNEQFETKAEQQPPARKADFIGGEKQTNDGRKLG
jgi:hypothetical protein